MLVVSRKTNQTVRFPNLGITIEILRIAGNAVRVGIDAPQEIRVLRGELMDREGYAEELDQAARRERHAVRNQLNTASLALHLLQKQLEAGLLEDAEQTLTDALTSLEDLDRMADRATLPRRAERGRRALIVEDCANERELLAGYLRLSGYQVDTVEDGLAAMMYLSKNARPDVVLLDMHMPRMDGQKTIAAIRNNAALRSVRVFGVSGCDPRTIDVPLGGRGFNGWFQKPLDPKQFVQELEREIESSSSA